MIKFHETQRYRRELRKFVKNNPRRVEAVIEVISKLVVNPKHPSLNTEKLFGSEMWTVRIDKDNRIFFTWVDKENIILIDIGEHNKYRRY